MNHLRKLGLASFLFLGLGLLGGTSGARLRLDAIDGSHRDADLLRRGARAGAHRFHAITAGPESRWDDEVSRSRAARPRHHRRPDRFPSRDDRLVDAGARQSVEASMKQLGGPDYWPNTFFMSPTFF